MTIGMGQAPAADVGSRERLEKILVLVVAALSVQATRAMPAGNRLAADLEPFGQLPT